MVFTRNHHRVYARMRCYYKEIVDISFHLTKKTFCGQCHCSLPKLLCFAHCWETVMIILDEEEKSINNNNNNNLYSEFRYSCFNVISTSLLSAKGNHSVKSRDEN